MSVHIRPEHYCAEGCGRPHETGSALCSPCARLKRAVGRRPYEVAADPWESWPVLSDFESDRRADLLDDARTSDDPDREDDDANR